MTAHDYPSQVENTLSAIEESDEISSHNAELLQDYHRDRTLNDISPATQQKNLAYLKKVAEWAGENPLDEMGEEDVKDLIKWVKDRDLADSTVSTYKEITRLFYDWVHGVEDPDSHAEPVKWIKTPGKYDNNTLPKDLLTREDIEAQIEAAYNDRDKAFIAILWETGARISEITELTVGDVEDRPHGKKIVVNGKTGMRRIPLVESVPHLNRWISKHPNPEKDAPLWCKLQQGDSTERVGYQYVRRKILKKNLEEAGIDKPCNPHHYRHSRASYLANMMTEAQMCEWFGWVQGSDVPAKYVHLSGRDIDNAYNEIHGIVEEEEEEEDETVIECLRCEELNQPKAKFCMRCGFAFDSDVEAEVEQVEEDIYDSKGEAETEEEEEAVDTLRRIINNNPEALEALLEG